MIAEPMRRASRAAIADEKKTRHSRRARPGLSGRFRSTPGLPAPGMIGGRLPHRCANLPHQNRPQAGSKCHPASADKAPPYDRRPDAHRSPGHRAAAARDGCSPRIGCGVFHRSRPAIHLRRLAHSPICQRSGSPNEADKHRCARETTAGRAAPSAAATALACQGFGRPRMARTERSVSVCLAIGPVMAAMR